jgi:hypothetical protein
LLACTQIGWTPLLRASVKDHVDSEVARLLLEHKADVNQTEEVTMHKS